MHLDTDGKIDMLNANDNISYKKDKMHGDDM